MKFTCASILQTTRTEFMTHHCSMEFMEGLELCERAEPYCKLVNPYFLSTVKAIEKQADTWCTKSSCETSTQQLDASVKYCDGVAVKTPAYLYATVQKMVATYYPGWKATGCVAEVCSKLKADAARVNTAYAAYVKLGPAYSAYAKSFK